MYPYISKHKRLFVVIASLITLLAMAVYYFISTQQPTIDQLTKLSNSTRIELNQAQAELSSVPHLGFYEQTYSNMCSTGEHSWKRNESYNHLCVYRLTYYYGVDANIPYKQALLDAERKIADTGWVLISTNPPRPTISEIVSQYPESQWLSHLSESEYQKSYEVHLNINTFMGSYGDLTILPSEPTPFGFGVASYQIFYTQESNRSPKEISQKIISQSKQPLMFSISKEYFKN